MHIVNLSAEPLGKLHAWIPHDLEAETIVFLPDACPGKSPLPTGTAVLTYQQDWRKYAVSDCGCGMRLLRSELSQDDLSQGVWDEIATTLKGNKNQLGDLGGGNHFLDALMPYSSNQLHFLIHTGSRNESGHVDTLTHSPERFDAEFDRVVQWAADNRAAVQASLEKTVGPLELLMDLPHNTYEPQADGGVIIRKGSVKALPGDINIIPSHMSGDVVLVRATGAVTSILYSLSHGTGRAMSRADCKPLAATYDFKALRQRILIPSMLADASLKTDGPFAYRELEDCLALMNGYIEELERFAVIAYMGHL